MLANDQGPRQYTFGGGAPALATVADGAVLRLYTDDCFGGAVKTAEQLPSQCVDLARVNPVTGPFYVPGAQPGDTLALHFAQIVPATARAVSATYPHFGALTSTHTTATLQQPLSEKVWIWHINDGQVCTEMDDLRTVALPLDPMHGTVGVDPGSGQAISTLTCGPHGGNMDTAELREGTTLYLGVNVDGAMFALGDGHARQGEGEACGVGVECAMRTTLAVGLIRGVATPWPRIESDSHLMSVGAARPLEDAYRIAHVDMVGWLQELTGLGQLDALQWLSQAGTARPGNVCDPNYTMLARVAKAHLPPGPGGTVTAAYGGMHRRLKALALDRS